MPATTFLLQNEACAATGHKVVDDALTALRQATGEDWRVERRGQAKRGWFSRPVDLFCLYHRVGGPVGGGGEFQIINFYRDGTEWSINHYVPAELVVAYMYGASW